MTERFKVHKMIEGCTSGEDIDVDFLKELIAEDRLVDDLTMHIEDTKENKILTYRECVNLLNENERLKEENEDLNEELMENDSFVLLYKEQRDELKKENEVLKSTEMEYEDALGRLEEENEKLKSDIKYFETTYEIEERGLDIVPEMCTITSSTPSRKELFKENEQLKQEYLKLKHRHSLLHDECLDIECERDSLKKDVNSLEEENERLKKDALNYYLNGTLVEDIKTLLVVLAFCEFPKSNRLSTDEFGAIARLQGFICENIIDLDELKKEVGR